MNSTLALISGLGLEALGLEAFGLETPGLVNILENSYCTLLWRSRGARVYNGGMGAEPLAGSRGKAKPLVRAGAKPPEAENLLKYWTSNKMGK